jgi:hypothetical protein
MQRDSGHLSQISIGRRPLIITSRLYKAVTTMHHIDELFLWLAEAITSAFDIQVTQFWARQVLVTGQYVLRLRAMVRQDHSLPSQVVANQQVVTAIEYALQGQQTFLFQRVDQFFSAHHSNLLMRYGLNYFCYSIFTNAALLPPSQQSSPAQEVLTPLTTIVLLFTRNPLPADVLSAVNLVLEQAIPIAGQRGLLLPATHAANQAPFGQTMTQEQAGQIDLAGLIPYPLEDAALMKSSNPLAGSTVIADKQARRLYAAIDGHKKLAEICLDLKCSLEDVYPALTYLLKHQRIQLFTSNGRLIDGSQVFRNN